jgi:hypothetical protein
MVMANNSHGANNELEISNYLNGKKFKELNLTMKEFIKYICNTKGILYNDDTLIIADYVKNNKLKQDIYITINGIKIGISLKMGSGNSCHQEKIEDFIKFIKKELGTPEEVCDLWRFFIWADGTLNGTGPMNKDEKGKIICRFDIAEFKKKYPEKRTILQKFIDENKEALINRAVFVGKYNSDVDFVYHGTYRQGRWISKKEVIDFQLVQTKKSDRACFKLGNLTIQAWNVSLEGKTEKKRGEIQLKYGSMKNDFDSIMKTNAETVGTFLGDLEEFALSQILNKNKDNPMWKILIPGITDFSDYYLVKVSSNQISTLSGRKVKTKSDAYVVKVQLSHKFLLSKEYILDENDLKGKNYEIQHNTGISIKMKESKSFTYQKLTKNSFCKAFQNVDDVEFWLTALLIYSSNGERYKNPRIITDLGNDFETFLDKVNRIMGISIENTDNSAFWDKVRKTAQLRIKTEIQSNVELAENLFMGKHWFSSPYHAIFLYEGGELRKNEIIDFSITTGSGRSSGKYNIEIIPVK